MNRALKNTDCGMIPLDWDCDPLSTVCDDCAFGPRFGGELYDPNGNVATLRTTDLDSYGRISYSTMPLARIETERFRQHYLKAGDLVITRSGTCGIAAIFEGFHLPVLPGAFLIRFRISSKADARFLRYYFNSNMGRERVLSLATGSVQQNLTSTALLSLKIPRPPLPEQLAIVGMLSALDDKIELNYQMNQTLEAMAWALFKSWFVDFDPVAAKAAGRKPYGMNEETASLFTNTFEDSKIGAIPKGWSLKPLDEIADYENGLALQNFRPTSDEYLPVIKIKELRQGQSDSKSEKASSHIKASCIIDDGDIIFSWSGSLLVDIWCGGKGALNQHLFKVTSANYPKWFYYFWTKEHLSDFQDIASGKATTMGHIQRHHLSAALSVVPRRECLEKADKIISPMIESIVNNRIQSRTLTALRDSLLPKLLSGEIRVRQAEKLVAEAV